MIDVEMYCVSRSVGGGRFTSIKPHVAGEDGVQLYFDRAKGLKLSLYDLSGDGTSPLKLGARYRITIEEIDTPE